MAAPAPLVVCGPSGVGKSVLIKHLQKRFPDKFGFSVSHTTRGPRPGEENGKDYHFSDMDTMKKMKAAGEFIESAEVHGNMYGTSREAVESVGRAGKVCVLDIDVQGAKSIFEGNFFKDIKFIFILPPSKAELERRLRGRGTETEEKVQKRLANSQGEIDFANRVSFFDHKFVLDGLTDTNTPEEVHDVCARLQMWFPVLIKQSLIEGMIAREIFDSRGNPTVEVDLHTTDGLFRAAVPSGASTGIYEALEMRDGDKKRLLGKGVLKAVQNINDILRPKLMGMNVSDQSKIDKFMVEELDGTKNEWGWSKSKIGANAILAVSMAVCRAGAAAAEMPLYQYIAQIANKPMDNFVMPVPCFNVINGGSHAGNRLACQEFMILPTGATSFKNAMEIGAEVYHTLKSVIKKRYGQDACNVGDEGGFAPSVQDNSEALDVLMDAIKSSGHLDKIKLATDVAASEFYNADTKLYDLDFKKEGGSSADMKKTGVQMMDVYNDWIKKYPLVSIEDPFDQDDWDAYSAFMKSAGDKVQIVGDDLLVTNPNRIKKAMDVSACNALLCKVNQIGSITESVEAVNMCQRAGWGVMVSHRSGETEDSFIADLVVGLRTGEIKTGAPCRSERLAKYNQLIRIEEELGPLATYAGENFRNPR